MKIWWWQWKQEERWILFTTGDGNDGKVLTLEEKLEDNHRFETPLLNHIALKQAIDQLPEEEAQLIKFRYMDNLSQAETAKRMGKNQVSVSRSERKILEKLRRKML